MVQQAYILAGLAFNFSTSRARSGTELHQGWAKGPSQTSM